MVKLVSEWKKGEVSGSCVENPYAQYQPRYDDPFPSYYEAYRTSFDKIYRRIGYAVRPSVIWSYESDGYLGLIAGLRMTVLPGFPGCCA